MTADEEGDGFLLLLISDAAFPARRQMRLHTSRAGSGQLAIGGLQEILIGDVTVLVLHLNHRFIPRATRAMDLPKESETAPSDISRTPAISRYRRPSARSTRQRR